MSTNVTVTPGRPDRRSNVRDTSLWSRRARQSLLALLLVVPLLGGSVAFAAQSASSQHHTQVAGAPEPPESTWST